MVAHYATSGTRPGSKAACIPLAAPLRLGQQGIPSKNTGSTPHPGLQCRGRSVSLLRITPRVRVTRSQFVTAPYFPGRHEGEI